MCFGKITESAMWKARCRGNSGHLCQHLSLQRLLLWGMHYGGTTRESIKINCNMVTSQFPAQIQKSDSACAWIQIYCFASLHLSFLILLGVLDAETGIVGPREERICREGNKRVQSRKMHKVRPAVTQSAEKWCMTPLKSVPCIGNHNSPVTWARSILVKL